MPNQILELVAKEWKDVTKPPMFIEIKKKENRNKVGLFLCSVLVPLENPQTGNEI